LGVKFSKLFTKIFGRLLCSIFETSLENVFGGIHEVISQKTIRRICSFLKLFPTFLKKFRKICRKGLTLSYHLVHGVFSSGYVFLS